ncbi:hypothetical protein [Roseomonas sp. BN140053]|uniref:hypothetical protein n=1 Tax=Roseomonas sp. BN140053 TaxID=3391898 RepID=UPI0039E96808
MPNHRRGWQPLFLDDAALFDRILARPFLDDRLRAWPGFSDMLIGESVRHARHGDAAALISLRDLYGFGLGNGLVAEERRRAVRALRRYGQLHGRLPASVWLPFLTVDPDRQVAAEAAEAWLDAGGEAAHRLRTLLEEKTCANRGGVFATLLRYGYVGLLHPLRDALEAGEVADAMLGCEGKLPGNARAFLAEWLDALQASENAALVDLIAQALRREALPADPRQVAQLFLPVTVERPILRPAGLGQEGRRSGEAAYKLRL